jgi:hypothetical protein
MNRMLILKRASASRPGGEWNDDDYDALADGVVVGRIMLAAVAPVGSPWLWTLGYGHHEDRAPTHGYEATREAAMAAFAKCCGGSEGDLMGNNKSCRLRPSRSTDQAMITSKCRFVASRHSASKAGRLSRPFAPLMP